MGKPHSALFGIPVSEIARRCKVDLSTARRWKRGAICPPQTAIMILERDLGCFADEWRGWTIQAGELIAPHGWVIKRDDALAVPLMHGQIAALRQQLKDKEESVPDIEDQPRPDEWQVEIA